MANLEKFLNHQGVGVLWDKIEEKFVQQSTVGDLNTLQTTAKGSVVAAINELKHSVEAGGSGSVITLTSSDEDEDFAKVYTLSQGSVAVGTIEIPKDLVVSSGEVVELIEGQIEGKPAGTYIKLVLSNEDKDVVYIPADGLVENFKLEATVTPVDASGSISSGDKTYSTSRQQIVFKQVVGEGEPADILTIETMSEYDIAFAIGEIATQ